MGVEAQDSLLDQHSDTSTQTYLRSSCVMTKNAKENGYVGAGACQGSDFKRGSGCNATTPIVAISTLFKIESVY